VYNWIYKNIIDEKFKISEGGNTVVTDIVTSNSEQKVTDLY